MIFVLFSEKQHTLLLVSLGYLDFSDSKFTSASETDKILFHTDSIKSIFHSSCIVVYFTKNVLPFSPGILLLKCSFSCLPYCSVCLFKSAQVFQCGRLCFSFYASMSASPSSHTPTHTPCSTLSCQSHPAVSVDYHTRAH